MTGDLGKNLLHKLINPINIVNCAASAPNQPQPRPSDAPPLQAPRSISQLSVTATAFQPANLPADKTAVSHHQPTERAAVAPQPSPANTLAVDLSLPSPSSDDAESVLLRQGPYHEHPYKRDRLDDHVEHAAQAFLSASSYDAFVRQARGKGDLHPDVGSLPHPAAHLLHQFQRSGTPVVMQTPPWSKGRLQSALKRGPHSSSKKGVKFLREEYADMVEKQQWTVLPAKLVLDLPGLRLSPLGLVPQRGRRDRMISDYSYFGINADTLRLAPKEAMQFGRALIRLLTKIHHANDRFGHVFMSKVDLSDGFYRLWLRANDTAHLAVLFPTRDGEPPLVGIPLTNPMGWCDSPPNFSACTKTVADLANADLALPRCLAAARDRPHRLDEISETPPPPTPSNDVALPTRQATNPALKPLKYWDIYVDDFLGLAQGNKWKRRAIKRVLFHSLDRVFRPLEDTDIPARQEPASLKKLRKGDGTWTTKKIMLGWEIDTIAKTITLPPHRILRLQEILAAIRPGQRYVPTQQWHKLLGELRSMVIALPGAKGLFSILQEAFRHEDTHRHRLRLSSALHGFLADFRALALDIANRPTRIAELVPDSVPATIGACDAAGTGMGGVHFIPSADGTFTPILWRERFPAAISARLVSFANPDGDITNSDLELAGSIAQHDVLAQFADVTERTIQNCYDNTAAVYWQRKGAATTTGPAAYLLRLQALHQRQHRYVPLHDYIPGPANVMADFLSRRWDLTDTQILAHFNAFFPQDATWRLCQLAKSTNSHLISSLCRTRCAFELKPPMQRERMPIGRCGMTSVCRTPLTPASTASATPFRSSKSLVSATETDASLPVANPWQLARLRTPFVRSVRRLHGWGPRTPAMTTSGESIFACPLNYEPIRRRIPPRNE